MVNIKKLFVGTLSAALIMCAAAVSASAEDRAVSNEDELRAAVNDASVDMITLDGDIELTNNNGQIIISRNVTIDLAGRTITQTIAEKNAVRIDTDAEVTIQSTGKRGAIVGAYSGISNVGTLTASNCDISGEYNGIFNDGTLTMSNCKLTGNTGLNNGEYWDSGQIKGTAILTDCVVGGTVYGMKDYGGTVTLNNCSEDANSDYNVAFAGNLDIYDVEKPTIIINGGTFSHNIESNYLNVNINNATITGEIFIMGNTTITDSTVNKLQLFGDAGETIYLDGVTCTATGGGAATITGSNSVTITDCVFPWLGLGFYNTTIAPVNAVISGSKSNITMLQIQGGAAEIKDGASIETLYPRKPNSGTTDITLNGCILNQISANADSFPSAEVFNKAIKMSISSGTVMKAKYFTIATYADKDKILLSADDFCEDGYTMVEQEDGTYAYEQHERPGTYTFTLDDFVDGLSEIHSDYAPGTYPNDAHLQIKLTATVQSGYLFEGWYDGDQKISSNMVCTVELDKNLNIIPKAVEMSGAVQEAPYNESSKTYTIENAKQLLDIANKSRAGEAFANQTIKLDADLDMKEALFFPIGESTPFKGTFDGGGHMIKNLNIDSYDQYNGLFGQVEGAKIENVVISNSTIVNRDNYTYDRLYGGAIAGKISGNSTITNCRVANSKVYGSWFAGGVAGHSANSTISDVRIEDLIIGIPDEGSNISAIASGKCGGITGFAAGPMTISNVYACNIKTADGMQDCNGILIGNPSGKITLIDIIVETENGEPERKLAGGIYGETKADITIGGDKTNVTVTDILSTEYSDQESGGGASVSITGGSYTTDDNEKLKEYIDDTYTKDESTDGKVVVGTKPTNDNIADTVTVTLEQHLGAANEADIIVRAEDGKVINNLTSAIITINSTLPYTIEPADGVTYEPVQNDAAGIMLTAEETSNIYKFTSAKTGAFNTIILGKVVFGAGAGTASASGAQVVAADNSGKPKTYSGADAINDGTSIEVSSTAAAAAQIYFIENGTNTGVYDIVLAPLADGIINRYMAADLTFEVKYNGGDASDRYTVTAGENALITGHDGNAYSFHMDGSPADISGDRIVIGQIALLDYGKYTIDITGGTIYTSKENDNIVDSYTAEAKTLSSTRASGTRERETHDIAVNVVFPNNVEKTSAAYTDMTVTISGILLAAPVEIKLGDGGGVTGMDGATVAYKDNDTLGGEYNSYAASGIKLEPGRYTFKFSGKGYRTFSRDVLVDQDKTVTVWNNVMDEGHPVVAIASGASDGTKSEEVTFLAGDIVQDNIINLYDLSSVVAYFGKNDMDTAVASDFVKYDLNRDGAIDSKDIAMVLVSWGR